MPGDHYTPRRRPDCRDPADPPRVPGQGVV